MLPPQPMASSSREAVQDGGKDLVQISIVQGDAFVWSPAWIARLRREHGIVGLLVGSLPLIPQQNVFLGVPLQLFEEEVVYLLRKRAAILVDDVAAHEEMHRVMTHEELQEWHAKRSEAIVESKKRVVEQSRETKAQWEKHLSGTDKAAEKRKERERKRQQRREEDAQAAKENGDDLLFAQSSETKVEEENGLQNVSFPITIATSSLEYPWRVLKSGENAFASLSSASRAGLWHYPATPYERARCATFENLRERGYYMGKGLRFGGDLVVYPGDPLRYHSHFTATIQTTPSSPVSAQELVAAGRLGTAVKKAHLLCTVSGIIEQAPEEEQRQGRLAGDDDSLQHKWGEVDYYSLTWAGFGT